MNIGGIIGGTIAAVIGAAVWAAIAYYGEVEIGYLAWGIGLLVGLGVSAGSRSGGVGAAVVAVLLTVASLLGGKYAAVHFLLQKNSQMVFGDEDFKVILAEGHLAEARAAGKPIKFRNGKTEETYESLSDLPPEIVAATNEQFNSMTEEDRTTRKAEIEALLSQIIGDGNAQRTQDVFWASFGPIDIVFFLLGIVTAGRVAMTDVID